MNKTTQIIIAVIVVIIILVGIWYGVSKKSTKPSIQESQVLRIGILTHQTGFGAIWGVPEMKAAIMRINELKNEGLNIQYFVEDCQSDINKCITAAQKLIDVDKVNVIIGPTWDEWMEPVAKLANEKKVLVISPSGMLKEVVPLAFSLKFSNTGIAERILLFLKEKGIKNFTIITTENAYFNSIEQAIINKYKDYGLSIVNQEKVTEAVKDFKTLISKNRNTEAIIGNVLETQTHLLGKQLKEMGYQGIIVFSSAITGEAREGLKGLGMFAIDFVIPEEFAMKYKSEFNEDPAPSASLAYDAVSIAAEAFRSVGTNSEEVAAYLRTHKFEGIWSTTFDDKQQKIWGPEAYKIVPIE